MPKSALTEVDRTTLELRRGLGESAAAVRWVRPEALHLTLRFLGEVDEQRVPAIRAAMAQAASGSQPISLELARAGVFGGRRPRTVWAGVDGELDHLNRLAERLDHALDEAGFEPRRGVFRPHITLGRVRRGASRNDLADIAGAVAQARRIEAAAAVTGIALVESKLGPGGAKYRRIETLEL